MGARDTATTYVSSGHLPESSRVQALVEDAYARFRSDRAGECSRVYPALARVDPDLFGLCIAANDGRLYPAGDTDVAFTIMSASKPFVLALVLDALGADAVRTRVGVNATGLPFDSLEAVERSNNHLTNPMVNAGAIATTSLLPGATVGLKWTALQEALWRFAGHHLQIDEEVLQSARATNQRNQSIAHLLSSLGSLSMEPKEAVDIYTRQCSLQVTARDLAIMGATLADGGVNPLTRERVVEAWACQYTLATMATAGMYETSGDWLFDVGLPGKSGIGGGIFVVSPGKGALAAFSPRLDRSGNSVKGQLAAKYLSRSLGLNLFVSAPDRSA